MPLIAVRNPLTGQVRDVEEANLEAGLAKFREQTGTDAEILGPSDKAVSAGDEARAKADAAPVPQRKVGIPEAVVRGATNAATFGLAPRINAASQAAVSDLSYDEALNQANEDYEQAMRQHPAASTVGAVIPTVATMAGGAAINAAKGAGQAALNPAGMLQLAKAATPLREAVARATPWVTLLTEGAVTGAAGSKGKTAQEVDADAAKGALVALGAGGAGHLLTKAPAAGRAVLKAVDPLLASPDTAKVTGALGALGAGGATLLKTGSPVEALGASTLGGAGGASVFGLRKGALDRIAAREARAASDAARDVGPLIPPGEPEVFPLANGLDEQFAAQQAAAGNQTAKTLSREEAIRRALETLETPAGPVGTKAEKAIRAGAAAPVQPKSNLNLAPKDPKAPEPPTSSPVPEITAPQAAPATPPAKTGTVWDDVPPEQMDALQRMFGPLDRNVSSGAQPLGPDVPITGFDPRTPLKSLLPPTQAKEPADIVRELYAAGVRDRYKLRIAAGLRSVRDVDTILNWQSDRNALARGDLKGGKTPR